MLIALANNNIEFLQHEYKDPFGDVLWGSNRIIIKLKDDYSICTVLDTLNIPVVQVEPKQSETGLGRNGRRRGQEMHVGTSKRCLLVERTQGYFLFW